MRLFIASVCFLLISVSCSSDHTNSSDNAYKIALTLEEEERWWVGVITDSHLFPLNEDSVYTFDFYGDTKGNQGQPLLISNKGRYIWNEEPFNFRFENGELTAECKLAEFQSGKKGNTLKEAYLHCSRQFFPPSGSIPAEELFTLPQFNTWIEFTYYQNQKGILEYANGIVENGFDPGVLMIDEGWFKTYGNWDFDGERFPDPKAMMKELKESGFKVILWVCPYYSPDGVFWTEQLIDYRGRGDTIWIVNAESPGFPAIMQWWDGFSNVIDLSNPKGYRWFKTQLDFLVSEYGVDGFKFDGGDAIHYSDSRFLSETRSYKQDISPNEHSELFVKLGLEYPFNEYRASWKMGGQAIAMRLRDKEHHWEDLSKLVPGSINQGLMGYPYTCPDLIGGGEYLSFSNLETIDQELIVRAAQCHALMPMMQFSVAPWRVLSKSNLEICISMADLHVRLGEEIIALAEEAARTGEPIIRSMEYAFPGNQYFDITDQFLLGDKILVAPVTEKGAVSREIVFPEGKWKGDDGYVVEGPVTLEVAAALERLPWYRKID